MARALWNSKTPGRIPLGENIDNARLLPELLKMCDDSFGNNGTYNKRLSRALKKKTVHAYCLKGRLHTKEANKEAVVGLLITHDAYKNISIFPVNIGDTREITERAEFEGYYITNYDVLLKKNDDFFFIHHLQQETEDHYTLAVCTDASAVDPFYYFINGEQVNLTANDPASTYFNKASLIALQALSQGNT